MSLEIMTLITLTRSLTLEGPNARHLEGPNVTLWSNVEDAGLDALGQRPAIIVRSHKWVRIFPKLTPLCIVAFRR